MEGYMDVLSSCIFGFDTSLAPLGTALTEEQAKLIKRYSPNILISFDMDKAGIAATERASYILKSQGFNIRVLEFDDAKDPDEYLKKYGREGFLKVVKNSVEIFDFLYKLYLSEYDNVPRNKVFNSYQNNLNFPRFENSDKIDNCGSLHVPDFEFKTLSNNNAIQPKECIFNKLPENNLNPFLTYSKSNDSHQQIIIDLRTIKDTQEPDFVLLNDMLSQ